MPAHSIQFLKKLRNVFKYVCITLLMAGTHSFAAGTNEPIAAEIYAKIPAVFDFSFIRDRCVELGVRCWLDRETAALYGSYVKRSLNNAKLGNPKIFNFNWIDIYGSNFPLAQLSTDADPATAQRLAAAINQRLSHSANLLGDVKSKVDRPRPPSPLDKMTDQSSLYWRVKSLVSAEPLENLDSYSAAAIELTPAKKRAKATDKTVQDVVARESQFTQELETVGNKFRLRETFPTLDSVSEDEAEKLFPKMIQFLGHSFKQHQMPSAEDQAWISELVKKIDATRFEKNKSLMNQFMEQGAGIAQENPELAKGRKILEATGIQDFIKKVLPARSPVEDRITFGNPKEEFRFWSKQNVMPDAPIGGTAGKKLNATWSTIEKGQATIFFTHSTRTLQAFESLTASDDGHPNAFFSGGAGWGGGDALYTYAGFNKMRTYGLHPLRLSPENADLTQGRDYEVVETGFNKVLKLYNRRAFRVQVPDYAQVRVHDILTAVSSENFGNIIFESAPEKGAPINFPLALLYGAHSPPLSEKEELDALAIVTEAIHRKPRGFGELSILRAWFAIPESSKHPEILTELLEDGSDSLKLIHAVIPEHFSKWPDLVERVRKIGALASLPGREETIMRDALSVMHALAKKPSQALTASEENLVHKWFATRYSVKEPELLEAFLEKSPKVLKKIRYEWKHENWELARKAAALGVPSPFETHTESSEQNAIADVHEAFITLENQAPACPNLRQLF